MLTIFNKLFGLTEFLCYLIISMYMKKSAVFFTHALLQYYNKSHNCYSNIKLTKLSFLGHEAIQFPLKTHNT